MNIKVKPLVWVETVNFPGDIHAETLIGTFCIVNNQRGFHLYFNDEKLWLCPTLNQAKQFAQDQLRDVVMQLIEVE